MDRMIVKSMIVTSMRIEDNIKNIDELSRKSISKSRRTLKEREQS
jgi:hypothetical protein